MISEQDCHFIEHFILLVLFATKQFHGLYLEEVYQRRGIAIYENYIAQLDKISDEHNAQASIVLSFVEWVNYQFIQKQMNVALVKYFPKTNPKECVNVNIGRISPDTKLHCLEISEVFFDIGLTDGEIKAVLAHEMGHIYSNHFSSFSKLNYMFYMVLHLLTKMMGIFFVFSLYSKHETREFFTLFIATLMPLFFFANKLQQQELEADLIAVNIFQANPYDLNSALNKIHSHNLQKEEKSFVIPFFRQLYSGAGFLSTHPSLQERGAVLTRLDLV